MERVTVTGRPSTEAEIEARQVLRLDARRARDLLAAVLLLKDCLAYIDTTWGEEDALPEPGCAARARAFLARHAVPHGMALVSREDMEVLIGAAQHGIDDWNDLAGCRDGPLDDQGWDDYIRNANRAEEVVNRLATDGTVT